MVTIPAWAVYLLVFGLGAGAGVGGVAFLGARNADPAETVAEVASVVEEVQAPEVMEAETRQKVATAPWLNIVVEAAVKPGAEPSTVALAAYGACIQGSQAQMQGAAAFACPDVAKVLVQEINEMGAPSTPEAP